MHRNTFLSFLHKLGGITSKDLEKRVLSPDIRVFNTTLAGACLLDDYRVGVGLMGMIERMFCEISNWIGQGVVENEWISKDDLVHYNLHEELDIKHSQDFFDIIEKSWNKGNKDNDYLIVQGLRMGASLFNDLYEKLYRNRKWKIILPHLTKGFYI